MGYLIQLIDKSDFIGQELPRYQILSVLKCWGKEAELDIIHAIEQKLSFKTRWLYVSDLVKMAQVDKENEIFGPHFQKIMFERAFDFIERAPLHDLISLFEQFEAQQEFLEGQIESNVKRRIVDEIHTASAMDITTLLQLFRNDKVLRKFLAYSLLEKFDKGKLSQVSKDLPEIAI